MPVTNQAARPRFATRGMKGVDFHQPGLLVGPRHLAAPPHPLGWLAGWRRGTQAGRGIAAQACGRVGARLSGQASAMPRMIKGVSA